MIRACLRAVTALLVTFVLMTAAVWETTARIHDARDLIGVAVTDLAAIAASVLAARAVVDALAVYHGRCENQETSS